MIQSYVLGAVVIVVLAGYLTARAWRWLSGLWFLRIVVRFLTGWHHDGRPGRPRRAGIRCGAVAGAVALVAAWVAAPVLTSRFVIFVVVVGVGWASWWLWRRVLGWRHHRTWLRPLHLAAHEIAGVDRRRPPRQWITAELDEAGAVCRAVLKLPAGWPPDEQDKRHLAAVAGAKLGIENAQPSWRLAGPAPLLTLTHSPPPPGLVKMADLLRELPSCKPDELLFGIGKRDEVIKGSLATDSPHLAISMGTGAGKSNLAGWLLLQLLIRGGIGQVLDAKQRLSYPWILKDEHGNYAPLPNVAYAWTVAQLHESMAWLAVELRRRGEVAFAGMDATGRIRANVGARLFTLAEELNYAVPMLRTYWQEHRERDDPAKSPAFTGLAAGAFAGRQVLMHEVLIGQMITAEVTGSRDSAVKENCGLKFMARYSPKGWRIMCDDVPMPPPPTVPGRIQVVTAGGVREVQTPLMDPVHARELVLAGPLAALPPGMPCAPRPPGVPGAPQLVEGAPEQPLSHGTGVLLGQRVTLSEAAGVVVAGSLAALRKASQRPGFPEPVGQRGQAHEYDAADLAAWDAGRR